LTSLRHSANQIKRCDASVLGAKPAFGLGAGALTTV